MMIRAALFFLAAIFPALAQTPKERMTISTPVVIATNRHAVVELFRMEQQGEDLNVAGAVHMIACRVAAGTHLDAIDTSSDFYGIKVLDGPSAGCTGFVHKSQLGAQ